MGLYGAVVFLLFPYGKLAKVVLSEFCSYLWAIPLKDGRPYLVTDLALRNHAGWYVQRWGLLLWELEVS